MERRRRRKKPAAPDVPGDVFMSKEHLDRLLRFDAELKNAHLTLKVVALEWELKKNEHASQIQRLRNDLTAAETAFADVVSVVEEAYDVNLKECAYDPETGRLAKLPE